MRKKVEKERDREEKAVKRRWTEYFEELINVKS